MRTQSITIFFIINLLLVVVTACQPPATPTRPPAEETIIALIQTITAQAAVGVPNTALPSELPAISTLPSATIAPAAETAAMETPSIPTATNQPLVEASATPYVAPTITVTSSPAVPLVSVSSETNCRTGPSQNYKLVGKANVGTKFVVVGKYAPTNYWVIKLADGRECWLWNEYATFEGNVNSLPEYSPAPVGRIEGEVRSSPAQDASKVSQALVNIGLGFTPYETRNDGKFFFEDVPLGEVKINVTHNYYRFQNSISVIVYTGQLSTIMITAGVPIYLTAPAPTTPTPAWSCPIMLPNCRIYTLPTFIALP
jgi:hypothetical protein